MDHAFDLVELKVKAYYGCREAERVLNDKIDRLKGMLGFGGSSLGNHASSMPEKRPVDTIGSTSPPEVSSNNTTAAQLAILGVGVDLMYLPRMRNLVSRHAQRLACMPWQGAFATAPRYAVPQRQQDAPAPESLLSTAAQHFARRTLSQSESAQWSTLSPSMTHEDRLRFLATR